MGLKQILKDSITGPDGTNDPIRILFGIGGTNGIITPVIFQIWAMFKGEHWDALAFCTAYGGMISAIIAAGGLAMKTKDKGMAEAQATAKNA